MVFGYQASDPKHYDVVAFNQIGRALFIKEKLKKPTSNLAATSLFFYENNVFSIAADVRMIALGDWRSQV